jgi:hypothetical protein
MNNIASAPSTSRLAIFSLVFGPANAILYWISDIYKFPIFSFYPATYRMEWGWTPTTVDDGPAMYWYGWIATALLGSTLLGLLAAFSPVALRQKIPPAISWLIPCLLVPAMVYSLKFYWR